MSKNIRILELKELSFIRNQRWYKSVLVILDFQPLPRLSALSNSLANSGDECIPIKYDIIESEKLKQ